MKNNTSSSSNVSTGKLGTLALAAIVISSMIGGGIYSLPQNMAASASAGAVLLAWLITGLGIYFIARTFSILSTVKPDLTTGIYSYSRAGFGSFIGFIIGWSYWLCQVCGNVGYAVITMDALNYFYPGFFAGGDLVYPPLYGSGSVPEYVQEGLVLRVDVAHEIVRALGQVLDSHEVDDLGFDFVLRLVGAGQKLKILHLAFADLHVRLLDCIDSLL